MLGRRLPHQCARGLAFRLGVLGRLNGTLHTGRGKQELSQNLRQTLVGAFYGTNTVWANADNLKPWSGEVTPRAKLLGNKGRITGWRGIRVGEARKPGPYTMAGSSASAAGNDPNSAVAYGRTVRSEESKATDLRGGNSGTNADRPQGRSAESVGQPTGEVRWDANRVWKQLQGEAVAQSEARYSRFRNLRPFFPMTDGVALEAGGRTADGPDGDEDWWDEHCVSDGRCWEILEDALGPAPGGTTPASHEGEWKHIEEQARRVEGGGPPPRREEAMAPRPEELATEK